MISKPRIIVWFSCGAASAVAAKLALEKYGEDRVIVVYCDTMINEHPDNQRFFDDVQNWLGITILRIKSDKFSTVDEVIDNKKYMSGIYGAPCTVELKKIPRFDFQKADDIHIFGYTRDEKARSRRFAQNNPELKLEWILQDKWHDKGSCKNFLKKAGISIPIMYLLGYKNNNCLGCVKAGSTKYWNNIRKHFPDVYKKRCEQSRKLGVRLVNMKGQRIFLDELPIGEDDGILEDISCGPECAGE